jgi:hypothetical protein
MSMVANRVQVTLPLKVLRRLTSKQIVRVYVERLRLGRQSGLRQAGGPLISEEVFGSVDYDDTIAFPKASHPRTLIAQSKWRRISEHVKSTNVGAPKIIDLATCLGF